MVITHHSAAFIKIVFGETTIAVNPVGGGSAEKGARFGADIALISLNHDDFNGVREVTPARTTVWSGRPARTTVWSGRPARTTARSGGPARTTARSGGPGERELFVIDGPGEYEVRNIFIKGFASESSYGGTKRINTVYLVTLEGMHLCFLGALSSRKLPADFQEAVENIDVLFVPIAGNGTLSATDAHELGVELEAGIIIPTLFGAGGPARLRGRSGGPARPDSRSGGQKGVLQKFLGEESAKGIKPVDKLTLKKKDLEGRAGDIVVLKE